MTLTFWVILGMGLWIGHRGMCWPLKDNQSERNMELGEMNKLCQEDDNLTVYEEVLNMCVSCSTCVLSSQDDHCHTCQALGIIPTEPTPGIDGNAVGDLPGDADRDLPKGVANDADKMDDAEVDDNARDAKPLAKDSSSDMGLSVRLAVGLSCGAGFAMMTLAVGVTLLKRRNGMVPVPQHDDAAADQLPTLSQQETNPPDPVHPSNALTNIEGYDQIMGLFETTV